jgi:serine/threonine protein phosphatase 1
MPQEHIRFLSEAPYYHVDQNRLFVHGGFDPSIAIDKNPKEILLWDRSLIRKAQQLHTQTPDFQFGGYEDVFVGHTPTKNFGKEGPQRFCNVWDLDTGAGWGGRLTIMDVDTKQFWQSDKVLIKGTL